MRVLITGGYGFIGSFAADRFSKEGHDVYIIDNLVTGKRKNVNSKHKSYILHAEDRKCEEIFRANKFDCVIHLASDSKDTQNDISGVSNILSLSKKYGVKKVVFASSGEVYGPSDDSPLTELSPVNPISAAGMNKWAAEAYSQKWSELNNVSLLVVRISNVYGPRQRLDGSNGLIPNFMKLMLSNEKLFDYDVQSGDIIYVEDVADAIYQGVIHDLSGVYNVSSNTDTSVDSLINMMQAAGYQADIEYENAATDKKKHSLLDNSKLKKELEWSPRYNLQEGFRNTLQWCKENSTKQDTVKNEENQLTVIARKIISKIEIAALFAFIFILSALFQSQLEVLDFKLLFIIFGAVFLGRKLILQTIGITLIWYFADNIYHGGEIVAMIYSNHTISTIAVYIIVGLSISYVIDRKDHLIREVKSNLEASKEQYAFLKSVYQEVRIVKEELQNQVLYSQDSFGKISGIVKKLDSLEPEDVFLSAIGVMEEIMKTDEAAIYTVTEHQSYLRLVAKSKQPNLDIPSYIRTEDEDWLRTLFNTKKLYVNKNLTPNMPLLMAPVLNGDQVTAFICLYNTDFENLTLYYQNKFEILGNLIASSVNRANEFVSATADDRYLTDTYVLKPEFLDRVVKTKERAKEKLNMDYTLLKVDYSYKNFMDTVQTLQKSLRETDYMGLNEKDELIILLSNTNKENSRHVKNRLIQEEIFVDYSTDADTALV